MRIRREHDRLLTECVEFHWLIDRNTFLLGVSTESRWAVEVITYYIRSDYRTISRELISRAEWPGRNCSVDRVRCTLSTIERTINIYVSTEASWRTAKGIDSTKGPHAGHIENTIGASMRAYSVEPYEKKERQTHHGDQHCRALIFTLRKCLSGHPDLAFDRYYSKESRLNPIPVLRTFLSCIFPSKIATLDDTMFERLKDPMEITLT